MKKFSKILGLLLASTMVLGTMAGCGAEEVANSDSAAVENSVDASADVQTAGVSYPLDTDETLTIGIINDKPIASVSKDISATPFAKAWAEQTGVDIEFVILENDSAMNLLFADGDLPDMIIWNLSKYAGGVQAAINDGVVAPLTEEELKQYAPDYMNVFETTPSEGANRYVRTDDGEYVGFGMFEDDPVLQSTGGMLVRKDWLDEFGMEAPSNIEELEAYLQACKEKGVEAPFPSSHLETVTNYGYWCTPFGFVNGSLYQIEGQVVAGYAQPEYKEYLTWIKSLADKGLMDTTFEYLDNAVYGDKYGVWNAAIGGGIGTYLSAMETERPEFDVKAIPSFEGPNGERAMSGAGVSNAPLSNVIGWITPQCENKELAMQFFNFGYTEAGHNLFNFGIEGESYTVVDGAPTYTELITNNPDGLSMQQAMAQYNRAAVGGAPFEKSVLYAEQYFARPQQREASDVWTQHDVELYRMPKFEVSEENASEYARIGADITTYVNESRVKFVTGELSLEDFESVYLKTLNEMGLETYLEIIQEACDRFYAR